MPIYEYRCECGHVFEVIVQPPAPGVIDAHCPKCGSEKVKKLVSASSFRLHNGRCGGFTNNSGNVGPSK